MFLQAAGMSPKKVRAIAEGLDAEGLTERQRALIAFTQKITQEPRHFTAQDTQALQCALASQEELLEAANVTAGFNFANRCADALGVKQEVPLIFQGLPQVRWAIMSILSGAIRMRMNFENRKTKDSSLDDILNRLQDDMGRTGMGKLPTFFERLRARPDLVAVQGTATRTVLLENGLSPEINLRIAYLISVINGDAEGANEAPASLIARGISLSPLNEMASDRSANVALPPLEREMLLFARDITLHADRTTDAQVVSLRRLVLTDPLILYLVAVCAAVNAGNRLNRILDPEVFDGPVLLAGSPLSERGLK